MTLKDGKLEVLEEGIYVEGDKLLDFVPQVKAVREIQTGDGICTYYDITISRSGDIIEQITVDDLYVKSWFKLSRRCPDAELSIRVRKLLERYLQEQAALLPVRREICLDKQGWCFLEEKNVYSRNNIIICGAADGIRFGNPDYAVVNVEDFEFELENSQVILEGIKKTADGTSWILYMVSYLDILKELFERAGHPIGFLTNLYGETRSGKTSLIKTLCSPSRVFSFRGAKRRDTALREVQRLGGHTVLFDDYHPVENKADRDRQGGIKDSLVRMVENEVDSPNIIISSEYLEGHLSLQDREIQIFLDKNMEWELLSQLADRREQLEKIRIAFYVQIVKRADEVVADIKEFCDRADRESFAGKRAAYRNIRYASYIQCVNFLFHKYFINTYGIKWGCDIGDDLQIHMRRQERHMQIITRIEHDQSYMPILKTMLLDRGNNGLEYIADRSRFRCDARTYYMDENKMLYISPTALQYGLKVYLKLGKVPIKKIIEEMKDAEVLETYNTGTECTKRCQYGRYYKINTDALNEYCSLFE